MWNVFQEFDRRRHLTNTPGKNVNVTRRTVSNEVNLRRRRRDAFFEDPRAEQRVDERALAGIELAHDDEQKELIQLTDGFRQRCGIVGCGRSRRQLDAKIRQHAPGGGQLFVRFSCQHSVGQT